jgi:hypothetical protein
MICWKDPVWARILGDRDSGFNHYQMVALNLKNKHLLIGQTPANLAEFGEL